MAERATDVMITHTLTKTGEITMAKQETPSRKLEPGVRVRITNGDNADQTGTLIDKSEDSGEWRVHLDGAGGKVSVSGSDLIRIKG